MDTFCLLRIIPLVMALIYLTLAPNGICKIIRYRRWTSATRAGLTRKHPIASREIEIPEQEKKRKERNRKKEKKKEAPSPLPRTKEEGGWRPKKELKALVFHLSERIANQRPKARDDTNMTGILKSPEPGKSILHFPRIEIPQEGDSSTITRRLGSAAAGRPPGNDAPPLLVPLHHHTKPSCWAQVCAGQGDLR